VHPVVRNWMLKNNPATFENAHNIDNMVPAQRIINHYKHSISIEEYRERLIKLHLRLKKMPKNTRTEKGARRKAYMLEIARFFDITPDKPFSGKFYFETIIP